MLNNFQLKSFNHVAETLLGVFIFSFCISMKLSTLILIILGLLVIYGIVLKKITFKFNIINLLFVLLYIIYAVGVFFTRNSSLALFYLENKLPFLILPFIFSFLDSNKLNINRLNNFLIFGVITLAIMGLANGIHCKLYNLNEYCFSTTSFSFIHHPTYYLVFNCISFSYLVLSYFKYNTIPFYKVVLYLLASFIIHVLSLSLAGILFFALMIFIFSIYFFYIKFNKIIFFFSLISLFILSILASTKVRVLRNELNGAAKYISIYSSSPSDFVKKSPYPMEGNNARLVMWTVAYKACEDHPFGVGTGNVDEILKEKLIAYNQPELAKLNYNPHNQFLQTCLEVGVLGLILLLTIILYSVYIGIKNNNYILIILSLSLLFNGLFESMLQRQSGIVFYTLCFCLFSLIKPNYSKNNDKNLILC